MFRILLLYFIFLPLYSFSVYVPLNLNSQGKAPAFEWNGVTPLALDIEKGKLYELSVILPNKKEIHLTKTISKDLENQNQYTFFLPDPKVIDSITNFQLKIVNTNKKFFNTSRTKITKNTNIPILELISISDSVTHGGAGLAVIKSERYEDLYSLAFIDENNIPFYPRTYKKDGFYSILFTWYVDHSTDWKKQYILAIDKAGNTNKLFLSETTPIIRKYRQRTITLPNDYADQKAKELALSQEDAKALEGDFNAINKVLAKQPTFNRWEQTRTTFKKSAKEIFTSSTIFSKPALPMSNAMVTATYGDQRRYLYQNKLVRRSVHKGHDVASYKNTPIYALLDGTVYYADWYGGNGKAVIIDHGMNVYSMYSHNSEFLVKQGQQVKAGTQISISGTTGQSTGDHLHLTIFIQGMFTEPKEWLKQDSIYTLFHKPLIEADQFIENALK